MATGAPGANGVWLYGEDDNEATFSALLNKAGTTVNTQLGLDRTRLTNLEARKLAGLVPVIPPTVNYSGGSAVGNSLGIISFTSVTSISLNNCFTSAYKRYAIVYRFSGTANGEFRWRLRSGGSDASFAQYSEAGWRVFVGGGSGSFSGINMAQASMGDIITSTGQYQTGRIELTNPESSDVTTTQGHHTGYASGSGIEMVLSSVTHESPYGYDGITFFPTSGNITGTIQVLAYTGS